MSTSTHLINNAIFNLTGRMWPLVLALLSTPFVVKMLGAESYGILTLVGTVLGYMVILDLGINDSLVKYVAQYRATQSFATIQIYVGTSLTMYLSIGLLVCGTIFLIARPLVTNWLIISPEYQDVAEFAFKIAAIGFAIGLLGGVFKGVILGFQRYDLISLIGIIFGTVRVCGTIWLLWLGLTLREIVLFNLLIAALDLIVILFLCKRFVSGLRFGFDFMAAKQVLNFGLMILISRTSGVLLFQFNRTFIGIALGAAVVTYYAVVDNLGRQMHGISQAASMAVFPLTSELKIRKAENELIQLYLRATKWNVIISTLITSLIAAASYKILLFWIGADFANVSSGILQILLMTYCGTAFTTVLYFIIDGVGKPHYNAIFALTTALINVVFCILLIPNWGLTGAAIANALVLVVIPFYILFAERYVLGLKFGSHLLHIYLKPSFIALLTFLAVNQIQNYWVTNLLQLAALLSVGTFFYITLALAAGLVSAEDIKLLQNYSTSIINHGKQIARNLLPLQ